MCQVIVVGGRKGAEKGQVFVGIIMYQISGEPIPLYFHYFLFVSL